MLRQSLRSLFVLALLTLPLAAQKTLEVPVDQLVEHVNGWSAAKLTAELDSYQKAIVAENQALEEQSPEITAKIEAEGDVGVKGELTAELNNLKETRNDLLDRYRTLYAPAKAAGVDIVDYQVFAKEQGGGAIDKRDESLTSNVRFFTKWVDKGKTWLVDEGPAFAAQWGLKLGVFLVILLVFRSLGRILGKIVGKALSSSKLRVSDLLRAFFVGIVQKFTLVFGLVIGLGTLGIDVGPLLAGLGIAGFVLGFALQDTLSNFAAGIMILFYRPYDVGDVISAGGQTGKVDSMSLVSTTIMTPDNQVHVVPNGSIWGGVITNITARDTRRVDMVVGVAYDADLDHTLRVLTEVVAAHEQVLKDPEPMIKVSNLGDSSVDFVVRPWCATSEYWNVKFDLTKAIKQRLDEEGIGIPFPQRDIHIIPAGGGEGSIDLKPRSAASKPVTGQVETEAVAGDAEK